MLTSERASSGLAAQPSQQGGHAAAVAEGKPFCEASQLASQQASLPQVGSTRRPLAVDDSWRGPEPGLHGAFRPPPRSLARSLSQPWACAVLPVHAKRASTTAATGIPPRCAETVTGGGDGDGDGYACWDIQTARQPDSQPGHGSLHTYIHTYYGVRRK